MRILDPMPRLLVRGAWIYLELAENTHRRNAISQKTTFFVIRIPVYHKFVWNNYVIVWTGYLAPQQQQTAILLNSTLSQYPGTVS